MEKKITHLTSSCVETPLGEMIAIADDIQLYFLDFIERKKYDQKIQKLEMTHNAHITSGTNKVIALLQKELIDYFAGKLQNFTTAILLSGSVFQNNAWKALTTIPYGKTINYGEQAVIVGNKKATRAVATANSNNTLAIIVPCHRVIGSNGRMRGYASGINRKEWLIEHEKCNRISFN